MRSELIFPLESWHNHSSSIVELPNGDLLVCWFHGSGERTADDVRIEGARWSAKKKAWGGRFLLGDTPGFPDTNPTMFIDRKQRLWLFWPAILANEWESALMKYRISEDYQQEEGPPRWSFADNLLVIPKNLGPRITEAMGDAVKRPGPGRIWHARLQVMADDKLSSRLGWFTRTHPVQLPSGRILVPMYSDGFSMGLVAISDDDGATWSASEPIVGYGNIQPSLMRRRDGSIVAYMRDNGPPPKRIAVSESKDDGVTWTPADDSDLPNPGASVEGVVLRDGRWLLVYNDTERGRQSLAVSLSDDEGKTWKWTRHLERDDRTDRPGAFHYPSVIQARDGSVHVTYSYFLNHLPEGAGRKSIKHAHFNVEWVLEGTATARNE
ncbi:MAG: exo-alpha-sialidase [Bryobacteraceae bacterium]|nr:exo-alpha-sialidase [Bryobacteraceae bacterium]